MTIDLADLITGADAGGTWTDANNNPVNPAQFNTAGQSFGNYDFTLKEVFQQFYRILWSYAFSEKNERFHCMGSPWGVLKGVCSASVLGRRADSVLPTQI